jgi:hypothetical protein
LRDHSLGRPPILTPAANPLASVELLGGPRPAHALRDHSAALRCAADEDLRILASVPRKLELVDGHIPGEQSLVLFLLTTMGLRRVASLVGRDAWVSAIDDSPAPELLRVQR